MDSKCKTRSNQEQATHDREIKDLVFLYKALYGYIRMWTFDIMLPSIIVHVRFAASQLAVILQFRPINTVNIRTFQAS